MNLLIRILIAVIIVVFALWLVPFLGVPHLLYVLLIVLIAVAAFVWAFRPNMSAL